MNLQMNLSTGEKLNQIALHELMGRNVLNEFFSKKKDLSLTCSSNILKNIHWDVCLLSANTHPMVTELKVNYWQSPLTGYTAGIKVKKYTELLNYSSTEKAHRLNTKAYILFFHFNGCWVVNLNSINLEDPNVCQIERLEDNTTAYDGHQSLEKYIQFDLNKYGQFFQCRFNYKNLRKETLNKAKQILHPQIQWMDSKHFWIDK